jgi:hypothetical protein
MVYDPIRGVCVVHGGYQVPPSGPNPIVYSDTWEWNGSVWTQRSVPGPARGYFAMAEDTARGVTVLFGGASGSGDTGDSWEIGCRAVYVVDETQDVSSCVGGTGSFAVAPGGYPGNITFAWQAETPPRLSGVWAALSDGLLPGGAGATITGAHNSEVFINNVQPTPPRRFRCVLTNACGSATSDPWSLYVNSADFDGNGDTGTDQDIDAFFACLGGTCCPTCGSADFNGDGDVGTDADIESFFRVLAGGSC